jgi:Ca2+-binding RTX toxin-like protein
LTLGGDVNSSTVFGGVSNIEVIAPAGAHDITADGPLGDATIFSLANAADNVLTLSAGWTADTTVLITGDDTNADQILNNANVNLTVKGNADDFDTNTIVTGGTGADELLVTADGGTATLAGVTNVEKVTIVDAVAAGTDVTVVPNLTTTKAQSIDGSALDGSTQNDETLTVSGDGATGTLDILGGGGQDDLTGGTKNDTIDGGSGIDSIDGKAGADHISGGAGNDAITIGSKAEFTSTVGTDTIDGGAGVDTITWTGAMNMTAASLATISNTEVWSIAAGSDFTISDAVLINNPGVSFAFSGAGTLSGGEDTAGAALMTEAITFSSTGDFAIKLVGSSSDDVYTFDDVGLKATDTIDGNAGTDTIQLENNTSSTDSTGNPVTAVIGANAKGLEKVVVLDQADADYAGNVTLTIDSGYTDTSLTIDASALDTDPTDGSIGEVFNLDNNDDVNITIVTGDARDIIADEGGAADIDTGNGNDNITSGAGNDTIKAGAGVDTIDSGAGTDSIDAGAGNDKINVTTWSDFKTSGGVVTINGGEGTDTLTFDDGGDNALVLTAPEVSQISSIESLVLDSGTATSSITFGNEAMTSNGGVFNITTNDGSGATTVDASAVSNGVINVTSDNSNASNDVLFGGSGDDTFTFGLNGLTNGDTINGFGGDDTIILNAADGGNVTAVIDFTDTKNIEKVSTKVAAATGLDTHTVTLNIVTAIPDALNTGALEVDFSGLTNPAVGGATFNGTTVTDSKVNFTITGSSKSDTLTGSAGHDVITAGGTLVADSITGGAGNDDLSGASGNDTLKGGTGNDTITGNAGADSIDGGDGNDVITGGDGIDTIDGEGGADTITLGAGNDIVEYDAAADSTGSLKDNIIDFTQSTINAVTTETVTAGDNININFGTLADNAVLTFSDKGDVANAGLAGAAIDGVMGSFVFAVDSSTIYVDLNGDGLLNASDLQITVDGLETFHSNDINIIVTAGGLGEAITGGNGDDSITGGAGADTLSGGYGDDVISGLAEANVLSGGGGNDTISDTTGNATITGGAGDDTITGGAGVDSLTGGDGDDTFDLDTIVAAANRDVITDFENEGDVVGDLVEIDASITGKAGTAGDAATLAVVSTDAVADDTAYDLGDTDAVNIIELTVNDGVGALANATDGSELERIVSAGNANFIVDESDDFYIIAYDEGKAFLYFADNDADTALDADEIALIATFDGITAGGFVAEDFILG